MIQEWGDGGRWCHESDASEKAKEKEFHMIDLSGGGGEEKVIMDKESAGFVILVLIKRQIEFLASFVCEICGSSALNVPVRLTEEECSEIKDTTTGEGERRGSGQSCCIFMVFLLTIILLHWFFKKMSGYYQNT
ncbi:hypothetical protein HID58_090316 [Brassica napus]|uniref:Uncharacterized protein n=1 Tax=Brassica napus TaxID=3708 RepID=A0ABQ7X1S9_BRANA|nr:hypothetical protein HID58_090316 [Brassica napus]